MSLTNVFEQMIFSPLDMNDTWLAVQETDPIPYMYNGKEKIYRPKNIITAGAAGGFVSTPKDLMKFSKGFWEGKLFDKSILEKLAVYTKLKPYFGPIYYGGGYMQLSLEGIYTLYLGKGELKGHSGVTGSFAFYHPEKDLHFIGDFTQLKKPSLPYTVLFKLGGYKYERL
jgi:CubicO group peptidase (beta-lactamase class C family)